MDCEGYNFKAPESSPQANSIVSVTHPTSNGSIHDDLSLLDKSLGSYKQLSNEHLGIGDTWVAVAELEQEHDTKPFFWAVRKFYVASLKKMLKKFPFGELNLPSDSLN